MDTQSSECADVVSVHNLTLQGAIDLNPGYSKAHHRKCQVCKMWKCWTVYEDPEKGASLMSINARVLLVRHITPMVLNKSKQLA